MLPDAHELLNETFGEMAKLLVHAKRDDRLRLLLIARLVTKASDELAALAKKLHEDGK